MGERNLPWAYKPHKHDDWGWIRDAEGDLAAIAKGDKGDKTYDEHRAAGTDPYGANADFIVKAVNNHDSALDALRLAEEALASCYEVTEYPANGQTSKDVALAEVRRVLASVGAVHNPK